MTNWNLTPDEAADFAGVLEVGADGSDYARLALDVASALRDTAGSVVVGLNVHHIRRDDAPNMTDRQFEIVRLIARGFSNDEVGEELGISPRTAKQHSDVLRRKLNVEKRRLVPEAYLQQTGIDPFPRRVLP